VVKVSDGEPTDGPLVEHASMTLARHAKIQATETRAIPLVHGHAVASNASTAGKAGVCTR
jgi:serine/threonine-protein kinase HipA